MSPRKLRLSFSFEGLHIKFLADEDPKSLLDALVARFHH